MRRLTDDMKRVVHEQRLAFVATVNADGTPNVSPKGTIRVLDDDRLVFADLASPRTVENLRRNSAVEINVVDAVVRKGYRFKGRAAVLAEGPRFEELVALYGSGLEGVTRAEERIHHVVVVEVDRCLPLISPAYDLGQTEEEISGQWTAYFGELWAARSSPRKRSSPP